MSFEIRITENKHYLEVRFPYNKEYIERAKTIWPYKWDKQKKAWIYPVALKREVFKTFKLPLEVKRHRHFKQPLNPSDFLLQHQIEALKIAQKHPKFCFFNEMGSGKTLIACEIIKHIADKTLVVAPLSTLESVWERTFAEFYPELELPVINLYPMKKPVRNAYIRNDTGVHIVNYETFRIHFDTIKKSNYKCLIVDESSILKGRTTKISKMLVEFGQQIECAYLLSGTPAPNTKLEFYPQIDLVAPGLLGYSFYSFRNRYFHPVDKNGYIWEENRSMKDDFIDRLRMVCTFVKKEDVVDLPEKVYEIRTVEMSDEQKRIYKSMKTKYAAEVAGEVILSPNVLSKIMRLRQITSGFLYYNDMPLKFADSKLKVLLEVLEEIGDKQVIIWCNFKEEIRTILKVLGDKAVAVYGEIHSQEEKDMNINLFKEGKVQYLVANPASLAHGVTLTNTSYAVYYSLSWSNEQWQQSQDRIHRIGQKNNCTYIVLICKNSIDGVLYRALQKKDKEGREVLEYLKQK